MARNLSSRNIDTVIQHLRDKKSRRAAQEYRSDADEAELRIREISAIKSSHIEVYEMRRHLVVSVIAALQSYHRGYIADLMEYNSDALHRGASLIGEKFALSEALRVVGGEDVSLSDIIAHAAPVNSISDMMSWLSGIFGEDFKDLLRDAVSPFDRHDPENAERLVEDVNQLLSTLSEAFELRHVLAHEAVPRIEIESERVTRIVEAADLWIEATRGIVWKTVLQNEPYTQFEINQSASSDLDVATARLDAAVARILESLATQDRTKFEENQRLWLGNVTEIVEISYGFEVGTMWPAVRASELARDFDARSQKLEDWAYYLEL